MLTLDNILDELKDVPANRLEELYQVIHALATRPQPDAELHKKILSFGGVFSDMSNEDFDDFVSHTKKVRKALFDRNLKL